MGCGPSKKFEILKGTPFALKLNDNELKSLASIMTLRTYKAEATIIAQGEEACTFFIIGEGDVSCYLATEKGEQKNLCSKNQGDFFGEKSLSAEAMTVSASVKTTTPATLLDVSKDKFLAFMRQPRNQNLKQVFNEIACLKMEDVLSSLKMFQNLDRETLLVLGGLFKYRAYDADQMVFAKGDVSRDMYVVISGSVEITINDGIAKDKSVLVKLSSGSHFGEFALLMEMPRSGSARCKEAVLLLQLEHEDFQQFLLVFEDAQRLFEQEVKDRQLDTFEKFDIPFFKAIPREHFPELADMSQLRKLDKGEVVFRQGEYGDSFYIVLYGALDVEQGEGADKKIIKEMGEGDYFGEIALVTDQSRTATITATEKSVLFEITKKDFSTYFHDKAEAYADFALRLSGKHAPITSVLYHSKGIQVFQKFCESEYSVENLEFWIAVKNYAEKANERTNEERLSSAQEIMLKFLGENAEMQVNLPGQMTSEVVDEIGSGKAGIDLFEDMSGEITRLMMRDSFTRFKADRLFGDLLAEVGSYESEINTKVEVNVVEKGHAKWAGRDESHDHHGGGKEHHHLGDSGYGLETRSVVTESPIPQ